jgi:hypothetical protein
MSDAIALTKATETATVIPATFAGPSWFATSDEGVAQQAFIETMLRAGIPPILWGPPGSGKTQTVFAIAHKLGYDVQVVIGARKEPTFLEGIPIVVRPEGKRATTVNALPEWFEYAMAHPRTIIFFDEIGSISEDVQASMLSVIEEREIDGVKLPDEVRFIAAGNDIDQAANGQYLAPPFANRFAHHNFNLPDMDWVDGFRQNFGKPADDRLKAELARLSGYLYTNSTAISPKVDTNPEKSGKAWASRRTWTKLAQALAHTAPEDRIVRDMTIASLVGLDQGAAFKTWDAALNFPEIDELLALAKDEKHDWGSYDTDKVYSMLAYALNFLKKENFEQVVDFFVAVGDKHQAVGFVMSGQLASRILPLFGVSESELPKEVYVQLGKLSKSYKRTQEAAGGR